MAEDGQVVLATLVKLVYNRGFQSDHETPLISNQFSANVQEGFKSDGHLAEANDGLLIQLKGGRHALNR